MSMRSMGLGGALVVVFSVLAALTLLPALLGILGARVNACAIVGRSGKEGAFWGRWSDGVMRHPVPVLDRDAGDRAGLRLAGAAHQREIPGATALPQSSESRQGYDILQSRFDVSALSPIDVAGHVEGDAGPAGRRRTCSGCSPTARSCRRCPAWSGSSASSTCRRSRRRRRRPRPSGGAVQSGAGSGDLRRRHELPAPVCRASLQGLLGAQQRAAALRLRGAHHGAGHGALPRSCPRRRRRRWRRRTSPSRIYEQRAAAGHDACYVGGTSMTRPRLRPRPVPDASPGSSSSSSA